MQSTAGAWQDPSAERRYTPVAMALHWLVAALLGGQIVVALILPLIFPAADDAGAFVPWHFAIGSTILILMLIRLAWRFTHPAPPPPADLPSPLQLLARLTHGLMYAILILLPILGWTAANAYGSSVYLLGFIPLPSLVAQNDALAKAVGALHELVAYALLAVIALHIAGALYHRLVKRDQVLARMLPS